MTGGRAPCQQGDGGQSRGSGPQRGNWGGHAVLDPSGVTGGGRTVLALGGGVNWGGHAVLNPLLGGAPSAVCPLRLPLVATSFLLEF